MKHTANSERENSNCSAWLFEDGWDVNRTQEGPGSIRRRTTDNKEKEETQQTAETQTKRTGGGRRFTRRAAPTTDRLLGSKGQPWN